MKSEIAVFESHMPSADSVLPYLIKSHSANQFSNFGPMVRQLEVRLAKYFEVPETHVVSLANATLALEAAFQTVEISGTWVTPSWTFTATNLALSRAGRSFRFKDVSSDWRIRISTEDKWVVDVCPFGDNLSPDRYTDSNEIIVIDAAASFDALKGCGHWLLKAKQDIGVIVSFHPTKAVGGAEGGFFLTNSIEWAGEVKKWSQFGFAEARESKSIGTNGKMNEPTAAYIHAALDTWPQNREKWLALTEKVIKFSQNLDLGHQPSLQSNIAQPYWILNTAPEIIERLKVKAKNDGVQIKQWWGEGCHKMPYFHGIDSETLSYTNQLSETSIGLPFHLRLSQHELSRIFSLVEYSLTT